MFTLPDAVVLASGLLTLAAAIWQAPTLLRTARGGGDAAAGSEAPGASITDLEGRVRTIEIEQRGFREEVRGEFKAIKQMIRFLPSGQPRQGGLGFDDSGA